MDVDPHCRRNSHTHVDSHANTYLDMDALPHIHLDGNTHPNGHSNTYLDPNTYAVSGNEYTHACSYPRAHRDFLSHGDDHLRARPL